MDAYTRVPISVVLCTYNGAAYLPEMLASLAQQSRRPDRLVHRDDGSSDGSAGIVRRWASAQRVDYREIDPQSPRLGPAKSFLSALCGSPPADVHFLADQDDVWLPTKIERAASTLEEHAGTPALYASRLQIVDRLLRPIGVSPTPTRLSFGSASCESLLTGCTMALTEQLRVLLASRALPDIRTMHDWWLYLLASATGTVHFDSCPTVLYRQHGANVLGFEARGWQQLLKRWRRFITSANVRSHQLQELRERYADAMTPEALALSDLLAASTSWRRRARAAVRAPVERQRRHDELATRLSILSGRF